VELRVRSQAQGHLQEKHELDARVLCDFAKNLGERPQVAPVHLHAPHPSTERFPDRASHCEPFTDPGRAVQQHVRWFFFRELRKYRGSRLFRGRPGFEIRFDSHPRGSRAYDGLNDIVIVIFAVPP